MHKHSHYLFSADLIRAVAIIFVVSIHVFSEFLNVKTIVGSSNWWTINLINAGARTAVPLFIMLSGMLILHTEKEYTLIQFLKKRIAKIGLPLIGWSIIYFLWKTIFGHMPFTLMSVVKDFINVNIYYHLYYLYIIAGLYLLTPVLKVIINNGRKEIKSYFFFLNAFFSLLLTLCIYFLQIPINVSTIFTVFIPFVSYYLAGDYFRHTRLTTRQTYLCLVLFFSSLIITALGTRLHMSYLRDIAYGKNVIDFGKYFYDYSSLTVALMSVTAFITLNTYHEKVRQKFERIVPIFISLAGASFGIYLIHPLFLAISNRYLGSGFDQSQVPLLIIVFAKLVGLLTLSYLTVIIFKKIPLLKSIV